MRVGTDGVLLGAWCGASGARRVLDIGTGSGLVAIMLAQRTEAVVTGVEIDGTAARLAEENARNCPWSDRLEMVHCNIRAFKGSGKYDLIVSNPPFFSADAALEHNGRNIARHTLALSHGELLESTLRLLAGNGSLAVILPCPESDEFVFHAWEKGLRLSRRTDVKTVPSKPFKRTLLQFSTEKTGGVSHDTLTLCGGDGSRTPEYASLTKDFYL